MPTLRVLAAALFGRATGIVGRGIEGISSKHIANCAATHMLPETGLQTDTELIARAASMERVIVRFTDKLSRVAVDLDRPPNEAFTNVASKKRELAVTRSIALVAMVQLHNHFLSGVGEAAVHASRHLSGHSQPTSTLR